MSWQDLIAPTDKYVTVPWTGGREVRSEKRMFMCHGRMPQEHGWHTFKVTAPRVVSWHGTAGEVDTDALLGGCKVTRGYLIADRLISDGAAVVLDPLKYMEQTETVFLIEPGLERFARVKVARWEDGRLIYMGQEFPLGPEGEVAGAYQDQKDSVGDIKGVTPALDLAFRFETWNRIEGARIRAEAARLAREEEARIALAERRGALAKQMGTGEGRREMAKVDFGEAARAALRVSGAELLDWRDAHVAGEAVVQYRFMNRKFECVCQKQTLRIVDAGVCLQDHNTGIKGDNWYTLESLPAVLRQAEREHKLVVFRHVDERGGYVRDDGRFENDDPDTDEDY